jgi:hypothetical protein
MSANKKLVAAFGGPRALSGRTPRRMSGGAHARSFHRFFPWKKPMERGLAGPSKISSFQGVLLKSAQFRARQEAQAAARRAAAEAESRPEKELIVEGILRLVRKVDSKSLRGRRGTRFLENRGILVRDFLATDVCTLRGILAELKRVRSDQVNEARFEEQAQAAREAQLQEIRMRVEWAHEMGFGEPEVCEVERKFRRSVSDAKSKAKATAPPRRKLVNSQGPKERPMFDDVSRRQPVVVVAPGVTVLEGALTDWLRVHINN